MNACVREIMDGMCEEVLEMSKRDILANFDEKDSTQIFEEARTHILPLERFFGTPLSLVI